MPYAPIYNRNATEPVQFKFLTPTIGLCDSKESYEHLHPEWIPQFNISGYWDKKKRMYRVHYLFGAVPRRKYWTLKQIERELFVQQL